MIARRYLGATKRGTGVSLISIIAFGGIMLAVATLIIVMSVMQGFRAKLLDQLLGVNGHIFVQSTEPIADYAALSERLLAIPGVKEATPLIQAPVYASARDETGIIMRGVRRDDLMDIDYVTGPEHVLAGSFDGFGVGKNGGDEIAIGSRIAYSLGVWVGDPVTLISGRGADTPFGPTLRKKTYRVGAIFEVGNSEYDGFIGFMPLEQAQIFFNYSDAVEQVELKIDEPEAVKQMRGAIVEAAPGYEIRDWQQQNQSYFNALQTERSVMRLILLLIVAVAALNIVTGLIMLVKDKTGDIAVLRTMGATQGSVMRIFFISGSLIGVLGTLTGVILGALFVWNIDAIEHFLSWLFRTDLFPEDVYYFKGVPAEMQMGEVSLIVVWSLIMSFVTTIYPAWRAARLDPVDALRYE
jgi:lipoprotein-releasing system permease protein